MAPARYRYLPGVAGDLAQAVTAELCFAGPAQGQSGHAQLWTGSAAVVLGVGVQRPVLLKSCSQPVGPGVGPGVDVECRLVGAG